MQKIAVLDYGMGNLHSVASAIRKLGYDSKTFISSLRYNNKDVLKKKNEGSVPVSRLPCSTPNNREPPSEKRREKKGL